MVEAKLGARERAVNAGSLSSTGEEAYLGPPPYKTTPSDTPKYEPEAGARLRRLRERRPVSQQLRALRQAAYSSEPDIQKFNRMLDFEARVHELERKAVFDADFAAVQAELPSIEEKGRLLNAAGQAVAKYARWEDINRVIKPILSRRGFSLRFGTTQEAGRIQVTCTLHHVAGHMEQSTLSLPVDLSSGKNDVQAIGSSTSYGKRYTASAILNLTSTGEDDDGAGATSQLRITADQVIELRQLIEQMGANEERFLGHCGVDRLENIPATKFKRACESVRARGSRP